jgi:hypothetical protein
VSTGPALLDRHLAIWRQPWAARRTYRGWRQHWIGPGIVSLSVLGLMAVWPAGWKLLTGLLALALLTWYGWLVADGLQQQNRPALARLVPGQATALRLQLLLHAALLTAATVAVLTLALGPVRPWLWFVLPLVVLLAWLPREPWLWLLPALGGFSVPWWRWAAEVAGAAPGLKLLALLLAAALIAASIGQGGRLHRWQAARVERWRRAAAAQRDGLATPPVATGPLLQALGRVFDWPRRLWRRHLLARGAAAPLPARLDLGLGFGGQWAELAWTALLLFGGLALALTIALPARSSAEWQEMADISRFGLCVGAFSLIASALHGRLGRAWARRREQALLVLLPGLPAGDFDRLEKRWRGEYLLFWLAATALVLGVGAAGSPGSLDYTAACAAFCLPLAWLAQHQLRRLHSPPSLAPLALAPVLAAVLAWPVQLLGVPWWVSLACGALVYALLAPRHDAVALSLPAGRRPDLTDTMAAAPHPDKTR